MNTFQTLVDEINEALTANLKKQPNLVDNEWHAQAQTLSKLMTAPLISNVDRHYFPMIVNEVLKTFFPNDNMTFTHDKNNTFRLYFTGDSALTKYGFKVPKGHHTNGYNFPVFFTVKKVKVDFAGRIRPEPSLVIKELIMDNKNLLSLTPSQYMLQEAEKYNAKIANADERNNSAIQALNDKLLSLGISMTAFEELKALEKCIAK